MRLFTLANKFDGDNWKSLDATLGINLESMDTTLDVRDLLAMHLLQGMQTAGASNTVWQRACHDLKLLKKAQWLKNDDKKPDRLKTDYLQVVQGSRDRRSARQ